ncbi:MAG: hypothetical protein AAF662_15035 [Pseudomonadota bacterium]
MTRAKQCGVGMILASLMGTTSTAIEYAGVPRTLTPETDALADFSIALRDRQPPSAFAHVYHTKRATLVWIGAKHETKTDSLTFKLVNDAFRNFSFDAVIVEGCPHSWGPDPEQLFDYVVSANASLQGNFQRGGETVPAVNGAQAQGATVFCGEPTDLEIKSRVLQLGFSEADVLGFYTLRSIPQWIRERRIRDGADERIDFLLGIEIEKNRTRLDIDASALPTVDAWKAWYVHTNGRPLSADFSTEEAGPLIDGPFGSNAVAAAISKARAVFQHELVISKLNEGLSTLVVYGASHLMIHAPALDVSLGDGCSVSLSTAETKFRDCIVANSQKTQP